MAEISSDVSKECSDVAEAIKDTGKSLPVEVSVTATFSKGGPITVLFSTAQAPYGGGRRSNAMQLKQAEEVVHTDAIDICAKVGLKVIPLGSVEFE